MIFCGWHSNKNNPLWAAFYQNNQLWVTLKHLHLSVGVYGLAERRTGLYTTFFYVWTVIGGYRTCNQWMRMWQTYMTMKNPHYTFFFRHIQCRGGKGGWGGKGKRGHRHWPFWSQRTQHCIYILYIIYIWYIWYMARVQSDTTPFWSKTQRVLCTIDRKSRVQSSGCSPPSTTKFIKSRELLWDLCTLDSGWTFLNYILFLKSVQTVKTVKEGEERQGHNTKRACLKSKLHNTKDKSTVCLVCTWYVFMSPWSPIWLVSAEWAVKAYSTHFRVLETNMFALFRRYIDKVR